MRHASRCFVIVPLAVCAGFAQAPAPDFDGTWNTVTSKGKRIVVTLQSVRRAEVSGTYAVNALTSAASAPHPAASVFVNAAFAPAPMPMQSLSTIRGRVAGNVLRFRWQEDGGHGAGKFTLSEDGQSFQGTFSMTDLPDDTSGGTWNGTRAPNFQGVWRTMAGSQMQFPELLLQQSGMQVSGRLFGNRPEMGVIKEGVVDGNTLRFRVYRPRPSPPSVRLPDEYVGIGELQMEAGSKSFKGTILGTATSGTLIGR